MPSGLILQGIGGFYTVRGEDGNLYTLRAQGKIRRRHMTPMVGDRVTYSVGRAQEDSWLLDILPRKNSLVRPPVANIDALVLTVSAGAPKADLGLLDRMLVLAFEAGIRPLIAVSKTDQGADEAEEIFRQYSGAARVYRVCAVTGEGLDALRDALRGTVHAFGGQSGAGKSTLINALYGLTLETGALSDRIERGKQTTRRCQLIEVNGGMVLDTPGFSLLETELIEPIRIKEYYPEFVPYEGQCRFEPCAHYKEPACAVQGAAARGDIDPKRYQRYQALFEEMNQRWRERYD